MTTTPCSLAIFYNQQHFLDMFGRLFPDSYLATLIAPGPGYEVLQADGKVFERASLAVARLDCGNHILTAGGAAYSLVTIAFSRPNATAGAVTIKAGTILTTSKTGRDFMTLTDLAFGVADIGPFNVQAIATQPAFEWDVKGPVTRPSGELLPGEIDTIKVLVTNPAYGDPTFTMSQVNDASGGSPPLLDALGHDRGIDRNAGEQDPAYRQRVLTLPDVVSPGAIQRAVTALLAPYGNPFFDFIETWDPKYQTCFDLNSSMTGIDTNLFVWDDPRPAYPPFRNRWLGEEDRRGAFVIALPLLGPIADFGMVLDDTAQNAAQLQSPYGQRGLPAWDVPQSLASGYQQACWDGYDAQLQAFYAGVWVVLNQIKAGGVTVDMALQGYT